MSKQHTQEPWHTGQGFDDGMIYDHDGFGVAQAGISENARRIVACVNACSGSPTDALEEMQRRGLTFGQLAFLHARLQQQRDTLLSALDGLLDDTIKAHDSGYGTLGANHVRRTCEAAIASVKEQA